MSTALSLNLAITSSTAFSIPDLIPIGFTPTAEDFNPSSSRAKAIRLDVVVPSPELWSDFAAMSLISLAPKLASLSSNSMDLATVTPSLVIVGEPWFSSMRTVLPHGPRVEATASTVSLMPFMIPWVISSLNAIFLAILLNSFNILRIRPGHGYLPFQFRCSCIFFPNCTSSRKGYPKAVSL